MCLIVFAYNCHPGYRLILGTNRDEFRDRPTEPEGFWISAPYFTNRGGSSGPVSSGIHGLSNHLLDTHWAKVITAKSRMEIIVQKSIVDAEHIFAALSDPAPFADNLLPDSGVGLERERMLSPLFIENKEYGTRSSTVILVDRNGYMTFIEQVFNHSSGTPLTQNFNFQQKSLP